MNMNRLDMQIGILESEESMLTRELRNTPKFETVTMKGRMRKTVENRLATCQRELKTLKQQKNERSGSTQDD